MAEKASVSVGERSAAAESESVQSGCKAPPAGAGGLGFTPQVSNSDRVVQPFPRSPKLQRKKPARRSKVQWQ